MNAVSEPIKGATRKENLLGQLHTVGREELATIHTVLLDDS
jgi:hypothetical protein